MSTNYEIVVTSKKGVWVAEVPESRGCGTHAGIPEEAFARITDLIPHWIEACRESGVEVPEPKGRFAFA